MTGPDRSGAQAAVEVLAAHGVRAIFGNPGTTELPLLEAIGHRPDMSYHLALHEDVATGMAAGFAAASGRLGVSILHVAPGVAHGLGNYYNAYRNGLPLLLISGQQDRRHQFLDPMLYADLEQLMQPFSKFSWEARTAEEVPAVVARACSEAITEPTGPTFVSLPLDLQLEGLQQSSGHFGSPNPVRFGSAPSEDIGRVAEIMMRATRPAIIAGDSIKGPESVAALTTLAASIGAAVYWEPMATLVNYPTTNRQFAGMLFPNGDELRRVFESHDAVLVGGMSLRAPTLYGGTRWAPESCQVVVLAAHAEAIDVGLNQPLHLVGDPARTLAALEAAISGGASGPDFLADVAARNAQLAVNHETSRIRLQESAERRASQVPVSPMALLHNLLRSLPENTTVVDEAVSNSGWVALNGDYEDRLDYFGPAKGGGIGYGLPAALGIQVADPSRNVLTILGDGAALYSIQGLWTAAHDNLPVVFCILNNASYRILKGGAMSMLGRTADEAEAVPGLNLDRPAPDLVKCADAFGIRAVRVEGISECIDAVENAFTTRQPWLIDIAVERAARPVLK
jgi:benzoylformate decarboxylase